MLFMQKLSLSKRSSPRSRRQRQVHSHRPDDTCVMYAYGEKNTDTQVVLDDVNNTLTTLFSDNPGPDVAAQLMELFN